MDKKYVDAANQREKVIPSPLTSVVWHLMELLHVSLRADDVSFSFLAPVFASFQILELHLFCFLNKLMNGIQLVRHMWTYWLTKNTFFRPGPVWSLSRPGSFLICLCSLLWTLSWRCRGKTYFTTWEKNGKGSSSGNYRLLKVKGPHKAPSFKDCHLLWWCVQESWVWVAFHSDRSHSIVHLNLFVGFCV